MEQAHNQWVVEDEEEELQDAALKGRSLQHRKDSILSGAGIPPSYSLSPTSNGGGHINGVCLASVEEEPLIQMEEEPYAQKEEEPPTEKEEEEPPSQKEEEVEEMGHVVENGNHFSDDHAAVGLGLLATNGEAISATTIKVAASQNKNSVYFDKQEGNEINGLQGVQNGDGALHVLPKSHGKGETDLRVQNSDIQSTLCNEVNNQCMEAIDDKVPPISKLSPLQCSSDVQATTVENFGDESSAKASPNLIKEIDQQLEEHDVEAVLAKQDTHELFCPNCKSCITKRVILRKRKRNIHNLDAKAKRDKADTKLVNSSAHEVNQGGHAIATSDVDNLEPPADSNEPEREPEVFRCLSCFSFFIPFRNGIKLLPKFGGAREPETLQNPLIIPASNLENPSNEAASSSNWFFSRFSYKGKKASEQGSGDASIENSGMGPAEKNHSSSITTNTPALTGIGIPEGPLADTPTSKNVRPTPDIENDIKSSTVLVNEPLSGDVMNGLQNGRMEQLLTVNVRTDVGEKRNDSVVMIKDTVADNSSMSFSDDMVSNGESVLLASAATTEIHFNAGKPAKDAILTSSEGSLILEKSQIDVDKKPEIALNGHSSLIQEAESPIPSFDSAVVAKDVASGKPSSGVDTTILSDRDFKKVQKDIKEEINPTVIKENKEAFKSLTADSVPVKRAIVTESQTEIYIGEQQRAEVGEPREWEILKSIVYGGLIESITSIGIVSSAAGSGAAPLNIIALGLANLIGGLFTIGHNLIELKNDASGGDSQQMNMQEDRYQELLGRRANFILHAVVAILSFLIFGSVPIVVYGLLIRENYYAEVKLAAVVATSLVCIILLAVGKVYTGRPPKSYFKTVFQYVTLALVASGVSYIVGDLLKDLLEKYSHSDSGFVLTMPSSGTRRMQPAWMSH